MRSAVIAVVGLMVGAVALATLFPSCPIVALVIVPLLVGLLTAAIDRDGSTLGTWAIRQGVRLLPASERADQLDEWYDHVVSAGSGAVAFLVGLSLALLGAPVLGVRARLRRRRRYHTLILVEAKHVTSSGATEAYRVNVDVAHPMRMVQVHVPDRDTVSMSDGRGIDILIRGEARSHRRDHLKRAVKRSGR